MEEEEIKRRVREANSRQLEADGFPQTAKQWRDGAFDGASSFLAACQLLRDYHKPLPDPDEKDLATLRELLAAWYANIKLADEYRDGKRDEALRPLLPILRKAKGEKA